MGQPDNISIVKKRRQELVKAVASQNGEIMEFVCQNLVDVLTNINLIQNHPNLFIVGLQAYQAYASWARQDVIFDGPMRSRFLEILFASLKRHNESPQLVIHAAQTILSITGSKIQ